MSNTPYSTPWRNNGHTEAFRRRVSYWLAILLCVSTLLLLGAGALVTSTGSSLAVPDWPLAYGQLFPPMVGGILFEHGHRLAAMLVGLITVILAVWLWRVERRQSIRWFGVGLVLLVIFQGVLGGITVLYLLPKAISISHAITAQTFFLLSVGLGQMVSPRLETLRKRGAQVAVTQPGGPLFALGIVTLTLLMLTLLMGAVVRHFNAGLAIPDFPLAYGGLIPPLSAFPILIHFTHRVLGVLAFLAVGATVWMARRRFAAERPLMRLAWLMLILVVAQILLGGLIIWSQKAVLMTTFHVMNGAALIGATGLLTLRARFYKGLPAARKAA
ncbi:MAG: COX15/CtaA family protein [Deltaproteobacteria bacterium]|nr:COX15/CtaA family protein [Deltaproteobacteria bacterium]